MNNTPSMPDSVGSGSYVLNLIYVIFVLAIIIGLIVLLIKFLGKRNKILNSHRSVRTLAAVGLGMNKSLQIIEVGGSVYLVGVGEDITLVDKISDPEQVDQILAALEDEATEQRNPLSLFVQNMTGRFRKEEAPIEMEMELEESPSFHEVFDEKVRRMSNRKDKMEQLMREDNTKDRLGGP